MKSKIFLPRENIHETSSASPAWFSSSQPRLNCKASREGKTQIQDYQHWQTFWEGLKKVNIILFVSIIFRGRGISHIWSLETSPEMAPMAVLLSIKFLEAHGSTRDFTLKVSFCRELFVGAAESRNLGRESCDREGRPRHYHSSLLCPRLPLIDTFNQKTEGPLLHPSKPSCSS